MLVVLHELISFNPYQSLKCSFDHSVAEETGLERIVTCPQSHDYNLAQLYSTTCAILL